MKPQKLVPRKRHPWYNFNKLLSHNATINMIAGGRGIGKTYGAKKYAIRKAISKGEQFIYLRRYRSELSAARQTIMADIVHEFPQHDFKIHGNTLQMAPNATAEDSKRPWQVIAYFVALSTAQTQKSVAFPAVTTIIFDEFIIETGSPVQYLKNEYEVFINFMSTVDRYQDKTRVLMLSNAVSIMNPYFTEFDIAPDQENEFVHRRNGYVLAHFPDSADFQKSIYETEFGKFIQGSDYAKYAVGNEFEDANDSLLALKDPDARYLFTLEVKRTLISIWYNVFAGEYYAQRAQPKEPLVMTMDVKRISEDRTLILPNDKPLQSLRTAFRNARLSFDAPSTRNLFTEVFKR